MKRYIFFFCVVFCISCIADNVAVSLDDKQDYLQESTEARALKLMEDFYGPATRANDRVPSLFTIGIRTKADDGCIAAKIVNFEENQGFVVMMSNQQDEDNLLAISNSGNIDTQLLERAIFSPDSIFEAADATLTRFGGEMLGGEIVEEDEVDDEEDEPYSDIDPTYSSETYIPFITVGQSTATAPSMASGGGFIEYCIADFIIKDDIFKLDDGCATIDGNVTSGKGNNGGEGASPEWGSWEFFSGVKPLIKTKWHQRSPYNDDCPIRNGTKAPAGCVAIATGQIAAYFQRPVYENWGIISTFGVYNPDIGKDDMLDSNSRIVAAYIHSLGKKLNMNYGATSSSSSIYRAKHYVRTYMGFDARINKWDWNRVRERLKKNIPVYTRGKGPMGGHAWIVDGYIIQCRKDRNKVCSTQYRTLVHMNWGWNQGCYDGYYFEGVFDPTTKPIQHDTSIGDKGNARQESNARFTKKIKTLTWSAE